MGQEVAVMLGGDRIFGGRIVRVQRLYRGTPQYVVHHVDCIDHSWPLMSRTVTKRYTSQSGTAIGLDLLTTYAPSDYAFFVEEGLDEIDEITFSQNTTLWDALQQLAKRIGATLVVDYYKGVHLFVTPTTVETPDPINSATTHWDFSIVEDVTPEVNRALVEGGGVNATADVVVGSTTLPVESDVWYNQAGGTVVSGPQRITYTGIGAGATPQTAWSQQTPAAARDWWAVAWSPTLSLFAAVSFDGSATQAMTSPDGAAWTTRSTPGTEQWNDIVWSPELALFVAVAFNASASSGIMTSPDGITWTSRAPGVTRCWGIAWSPELGLFAVTVNAGGAIVLTSPDGITWTQRTAPSNRGWRRICWAAELGIFVAVSDAAAGNVMTSPDGITWTAHTDTQLDSTWNSVAWSPELGLLMAVGSSTGRVETSPDGTTWTLQTTPNLSGGTLDRVVWSPGRHAFIAVGPGGIFMSTDGGVTWTTVTTPGAANWRGVAWAPDIATVVVVADNATSIQVLTNQGVAYAQLTGIPASGAGSIQYAIAQGDAVNLLVQEDDTAAQAQLAAIRGGDGVIEDYTVDGRISETEARARALAKLELAAQPLKTVQYKCRDRKAFSGSTVHVDLYEMNAHGDFLIQDVQISGFHESDDFYPTFDVTAASTRTTFEDLLRLTRQSLKAA